MRPCSDPRQPPVHGRGAGGPRRLQGGQRGRAGGGRGRASNEG